MSSLVSGERFAVHVDSFKHTCAVHLEADSRSACFRRSPAATTRVHARRTDAMQAPPS